MKKLWKPAASFAALLFWILVWHMAASKVGLELIVPKPLKVFQTLLELGKTAPFYTALFASFLRIVSGFLLGLLCGVLLAVLCSRSKLLNALFSPLMAVIRATPVASFIIVVILWIDRSFVPVLICFLMVFPVIFQNTCLGIASIGKETVEMTEMFGIRGKKRFFKVYVPMVSRYVSSASRVAIGLAWKAGVAAEVLALPKASIGIMIYNAKLYLETPSLYAWTVAIIVVSILIEKLVALLFPKERK